MRKICLLLGLTFLIVFLSGCWDYREIEDVAIASTIAIDKDEKSNEYIFNVEIIDVKGTTSGVDLNPVIVESRGATIVDAVRNMISLTTKTPYWSHVTMIILGQNIATEGISPILDWVARSPELKLSLRIFVSKEETAKEILNKEQEYTKIRTFEYERVRKSYQYLSKLPDIKANKVINEVQGKELFTVLPTVEIVDVNGKSAANFIGSAYFDKGKLAGFLNPIDTMKYLFVTNQIKGGILTFPTDKHGHKVTLDIYRNNTNIKVSFIDGIIHLLVNIKPTVNISEIDGEYDYTSYEGRKILKEKADSYLEGEIKSFIEEIQKYQGIDIFNFGNRIKKRHPYIWRKIENNWEEIFKELKITVDSDIRIKGSQHISTPIGVDVE